MSGNVGAFIRICHRLVLTGIVTFCNYYCLIYSIEEETDMLVRDRGLLYYRLLKSDVSAAKRVVCGSQKILSHLISPPKAVR